MKKIVFNTIAAVIALGCANTARATQQELDLPDQPAQSQTKAKFDFDDFDIATKKNILQHVHVDDLNTLGKVCKQWLEITKDKRF